MPNDNQKAMVYTAQLNFAVCFWWEKLHATFIGIIFYSANGLLFIYDIMILLICFLEIYPDISGFRIFSRIFPNSHEIFKFLYRFDAILLSCKFMILFSGKLFGFRIFPDFPDFSGFFPDFCRIFPDFPDFYLLVKNKSLLCSRSRTLRI